MGVIEGLVEVDVVGQVSTLTVRVRPGPARPARPVSAEEGLREEGLHLVGDRVDKEVPQGAIGLVERLLTSAANSVQDFKVCAIVGSADKVGDHAAEKDGVDAITAGVVLDVLGGKSRDEASVATGTVSSVPGGTVVVATT